MQWLSGRVPDSRPRGRRFEPRRRHCVVVLEHNLVLVHSRKTHPCLTERLLMGRKQIKQKRGVASVFLCLYGISYVFNEKKTHQTDTNWTAQPRTIAGD